MTSYYLTCGSMFLLALAHLTNAPGSNRMANTWLGVFFFCAANAMLAFIAQSTGLDIQYPLLVPLSEATRLVMAPALYLCVLFFAVSRRSRRTDYLHFVPAVLFLPMLFINPAGFPPFLGILVGISVKLQLLVYWLLSFRLLYKYRPALKWLLYLVLGVAVLMIFWYNQVFRINEGMQRFTGIAYLLAVYVIAFFSLKHREIAVKRKSSSPRVSEEMVPLLKDRLEVLMVREQVFTDCDLTLPQLADKMGISVHELSYLLNHVYKQNYYQFINQHRVARAKELMCSHQHRHLSILGIAFEAGFNSKTTFNTAFKKFMGMSPSEFQVRTDTDGQ